MKNSKFLNNINYPKINTKFIFNNSSLITSDLIRKYIQKVWEEKVIPIMQQKNNQGYILIQFQLEKTSGGFISIDKMWGTTGTQEEKILFINNIIAELFLKDSGYTDVFFSAVNFHGFYSD